MLGAAILEISVEEIGRNELEQINNQVYWGESLTSVISKLRKQYPSVKVVPLEQVIQNINDQNYYEDSFLAKITYQID